MDELIALIAKTWGIAGLLILFPIFVVVLLYKENRRLHSERHETDQQRVKDAQDVSAKMMSMAQEQASLNKETNMTLEKVGDLLAVLRDRR